MNQYALLPGKRERGVISLMREAEKQSGCRLRPQEISPGEIAPLLLAPGGKKTARCMIWGFPNFQNSGPIYAAKAETIDERSTFHRSVLERRCIIPTTGFYDKVTDGSDKGRYIFHLSNTNELYMAGIYNSYKDDNGQEKEYFAMLTTSASPSVAAFNDRMPVVLRKNEWNQWLAGEYTSLYDRSELKLLPTRCEEE